MKKGIIILILCLICLCIAVPAVISFGGVIEGEEGLIEKARKEIPVAEADTIDLIIAGEVTDGDEILIWFKSGNEYQNNRYTPIAFTALGDDKYRFEKTYKPIDRGDKTAVVYWKDNFVCCIDNPNCRALEITYQDGSKNRIPVDETPFVYSTRIFSGEYTFVDENGNRL